MKNLVHSLLLIAAVSSFTVACKKEGITPNQDDKTLTPAALNERGSGGTLVSPQTYKLTRRGTDTLIYNRDGRLGKVAKDAANYTVYTYGINSITAKMYINNALFRETYYKLDPATGRAVDATSKIFLQLGDNFNTAISAEAFTYDASGRLKTKYNMSNPKQYNEYIYFADELQIHVHGSDGKGTHFHLYPFKNKILNTFKLNPENSGLDIYLNIFGAATKYLPSGKHIMDNATQAWTTAEVHTFNLNQEGYPKQLVRKNLLTNTSTTETFAYTPVK
jgi:hypothetical protein